MARTNTQPASKTRSNRRRRTSGSRNWKQVIERLNQSNSGEMRIRMGSPGSAQVTRVRLLEQYSNLEASTVGAILHLRLSG